MSNGKHSVKKKKRINLKKFIQLLILIGLIALLINNKNYLVNLFKKSPQDFLSNTSSLNDNVKIASSETLSQNHIIENMKNIETYGINISSHNDVSTIKGNIVNNSNTNIETFDSTLTLLDQNNFEICKLNITIDPIPANSEITFSAMVTLDLTNAVDYKIKAVD